MIPPQVALLAAQYGTKILAALILTTSLVAGYYYWKHEVATEAHNEAVVECNQSQEKFRIDAEHFKTARQKEVDELKNEQNARLQHAIETYIAHYESQRATPAATSLRVKADCPVGAGSNAVSGADKGRSATKEGVERSGEAELSPGALQQFNKVINDIEKMELKCEQLLNLLP